MTQVIPKRKTISQTFAALREKKQIALMPFIPAGYPNLETTAATIESLDKAGADLIEIGIPFSDPIADGPVIQAAFVEALKNKISVSDIFKTIGEVREKVSIPLVAMLSYSVVFRYGLARFLTNAKMCGFDGLIIPDLPPPEAQKICTQIRAAGLDTVLLIAPTTSEKRREEIAKLCSGFIYYLSVSGITGERKDLPSDLRANVAAIKSHTDKPVCVGFGVSKPEHVKQLADVADGAIVGTAFVRKMNERIGESSEMIAKAAAEYARELLSLVR